MRRLVEAARSTGAELIEFALVVGNLSEEEEICGIELVPLFAESITTWAPEECPLCASGSTAVNPRADWLSLRDGMA